MLTAAFADGIVVFLIPILLANFTKTDLSFESFYRLVPYIVVCFAASLVLQWYLRRDSEAFAKEFGNYLRLKYFRIIARLDLSTVGTHHSGYLLSLVTRICDQSSQVIFSFAWLIAHSAATLLLFFFFTADESVSIAILNAVLLLLFLCVSVALSRKIVPYFAGLNVAHASLVERYVDLVSNISTVKKLSILEFAESQIADRVEKNEFAIRALQRVHANRWFILHSVFGLAFLATISFLLYRIASGSSSASTLILFVSAYSIIRSQIERLSELVTDLLGLNAYTSELSRITDKSRSPTGEAEAHHWEVIEFRDLKFRYNETQREIQIPFFRLQRGEKVLITGESGQGKSTFLMLLGGFLSPSSGSRLLDENNFDAIKAEALSELFSLVSQDTELLNISVRSNLAFGRVVQDDVIIEILKDLRLTEWLAELPHGLESVVGEKGFKLSAGQRQRINIARALLLDRQILLFDEPTSHLDESTEEFVVQALEKHLRGKTAVFVTHRPAIAKLSNVQYSFENGIMRARK